MGLSTDAPRVRDNKGRIYVRYLAFGILIDVIEVGQVVTVEDIVEDAGGLNIGGGRKGFIKR